MIRIVNRDRKGVAENGGRFLKSNTVLAQVSRILLRIPFERGSFHYQLSLSKHPSERFQNARQYRRQRGKNFKNCRKVGG